jgi:hypothetical protein
MNRIRPQCQGQQESGEIGAENDQLIAGSYELLKARMKIAVIENLQCGYCLHDLQRRE